MLSLGVLVRSHSPSDRWKSRINVAVIFWKLQGDDNSGDEDEEKRHHHFGHHQHHHRRDYDDEWATVQVLPSSMGTNSISISTRLLLNKGFPLAYVVPSSVLNWKCGLELQQLIVVSMVLVSESGIKFPWLLGCLYSLHVFKVPSLDEYTWNEHLQSMNFHLRTVTNLNDTECWEILICIDFQIYGLWGIVLIVE